MTVPHSGKRVGVGVIGNGRFALHICLVFPGSFTSGLCTYSLANKRAHDLSVCGPWTVLSSGDVRILNALYFCRTAQWYAPRVNSKFESAACAVKQVHSSGVFFSDQFDYPER